MPSSASTLFIKLVAKRAEAAGPGASAGALLLMSGKKNDCDFQSGLNSGLPLSLLIR